jgi:hypothetical protein
MKNIILLAALCLSVLLVTSGCHYHAHHYSRGDHGYHRSYRGHDRGYRPDRRHDHGRYPSRGDERRGS